MTDTLNVAGKALGENDVALLVGELDLLETEEATRIAAELRAAHSIPAPEEATADTLMRALEHLRRLKAIPLGSALTDLRDSLIGTGRYGSGEKYVVDPLDGRQPWESGNYGPPYGEGDRFVDIKGQPWFVERIDADSEPTRLVVATWRRRNDRI